MTNSTQIEAIPPLEKKSRDAANWAQAGNLLYNSAIRSILHLVSAPIRSTKKSSAR